MSNPSKPLVSVYLPTHNRSKSLERAIQSVFNQTWKPIELIVVDDGSDDQTHDLLSKLQKSHPFRIIRNTVPAGASASRNTAIQQANGEFVAGLDDDDYWTSHRIEWMMQEFRDGFSAVCSNDKMDYGDKEIVWKKKRTITLQDLLYYNRVGNQVLTKKEYILGVGGYDESLASAQDYDLWIRLVQEYGPIKNIPKTLQVVSMRENQHRITTSAGKMEGYRACFEKHRNKMNSLQIRYQFYRMKLASGEKVSWIELFKSVPSGLLIKEITRKLFL